MGGRISVSDSGTGSGDVRRYSLWDAQLFHDDLRGGHFGYQRVSRVLSDSSAKSEKCPSELDFCADEDGA